MRSLLVCALWLSGCPSSHVPPDAGSDATPPDAPARPDGGGCSCRSGSFHVTGDGGRFDYELVVRECATTTCDVGGTPRSCYPTPDGVFRVDLDGAGYEQLIFDTRPCARSWTGTWAAMGAPPVPIVATPVP